MPLEDLCKGMPDEFVEFMHIVRNLRFTEEPPYEALRNIFVKLRDTFCGGSTEWIHTLKWREGPLGDDTNDRAIHNSNAKPENHANSNIHNMNTNAKATPAVTRKRTRALENAEKRKADKEPKNPELIVVLTSDDEPNEKKPKSKAKPKDKKPRGRPRTKKT